MTAPAARNPSANMTPKVLMETPKTSISGCTGPRLLKVVQGVDHAAVDARLEVQVRAGRVPGAADGADRVALADRRADVDVDARLMPVAGRQRRRVLDARVVAVAAGPAGDGDAPAGRRVDRRAARHGDVHAGVTGLVGPVLAERARDGAVDRPHPRPAAAVDRAAPVQGALDPGLLL